MREKYRDFHSWHRFYLESMEFCQSRSRVMSLKYIVKNRRCVPETCSAQWHLRDIFAQLIMTLIIVLIDTNYSRLNSASSLFVKVTFSLLIYIRQSICNTWPWKGEEKCDYAVVNVTTYFFHSASSSNCISACESRCVIAEK